MRMANIALLVILAAHSGVRAESSPQATASVFSKAGDAAKVKPAFLPLPPGAVTPKGWLRDWAVEAAHGITGHLDEYSDTFGKAWKGYAFPALGADKDGTGWPLEQSSYWLDGAVRLAYMLDDKALIEKVGKRLDTVVDGVLNGGESFIYWRPKTVLGNAFNNWAHSHMGRALVAYYQATGNPRILQALVKVYRNYPLPEFGERDFVVVSGSVNVDPMVDTYLMSGDRRILDNVVEYARRESYRNTAGQWLHGDIPVGHGVIFYENIRVPALLYPWTGDKDDLGATLQAMAWLDRNHMLPIGISSSEEWHSGIGATRNVETCNVAASMWTYLWMLRITGGGSYADRIEKIFFNAGPAPVDREFKTMSYYQTPNRYSTALQQETPRSPGIDAYRFTKIGSPVLCCVGNLNRVIPNYVMHMWMATLDRGLAATLYGPSEVHARVADAVAVDIEEHTVYPFEEGITVTVKPARAVAFPLYMRIPGWCRTPKIRINGKSVRPEQTGQSFVKLTRTWRENDRVELRFPMSVQIVNGKETPFPRVPYFLKAQATRIRSIAKEAGIENPYASVYYGPLLFSLPIRDEGPNQEAPDVRYNYALDVKPSPAGLGKAQVVRHPMPAKWNWGLNAPVQLVLKAREFDWRPTEPQPMPDHVITGGRPAKVTLVPYGCTKFRVSMFPVTKAAWRSKR